MNNKILLGAAVLLSLGLMSPPSEAGGLFRKKDPAEKERAAAEEQAKAQKWEAAYIKRTIIPGKTSMADIKGIWGRPSSTDNTGNTEVWWFYREDSGARGLVTKLRRAASPFSGTAPRAIRGTDNAIDTVDHGRDIKRDANDETGIINSITVFFDEKGIVSEMSFNH